MNSTWISKLYKPYSCRQFAGFSSVGLPFAAINVGTPPIKNASAKSPMPNLIQLKSPLKQSSTPNSRYIVSFLSVLIICLHLILINYLGIHYFSNEVPC